jgi:hypothetical protein
MLYLCFGTMEKMIEELSMYFVWMYSMSKKKGR